MIVGEPISTVGYTTRDMKKLAAVVQKAVEDLYYRHAEIPDPREAPTTAPVGQPEAG